MDSLYDHFRLKITDKPVVFHNSTLRNQITQSLWKKIRLEVLEKEDCKCSICEFKPEEHEIRFLHVHEVENYDFENGIVELADLNLICKNCHSFQHMGRTQKVSTEEQMNDLIKHFMKVNDCDYIDYQTYYLESLAKNINRVQGKATFDKVKFRVTGDIPYKEDVINQLTEKGIYSELQRIIKVYKKEGIWNVDYNGDISIRTISKSNALEEARKLIPWNDHQTIIGVYNVTGNLMKTYTK